MAERISDERGLRRQLAAFAQFTSRSLGEADLDSLIFGCPFMGEVAGSLSCSKARATYTYNSPETWAFRSQVLNRTSNP